MFVFVNGDHSELITLRFNLLSDTSMKAQPAKNERCNERMVISLA